MRFQPQNVTLLHFINIHANFQLPISITVDFIPKKVELLIRFFEPFWISRVFHFFLGTFGKVEGLPGPIEALDEIYTQSKIDISGSIESLRPCKTLQLQQLSCGGFLESFLCFQNFNNLNFCVFHLIWVKIFMGANIGQRTTQNVFERATAIF